MGRLEKEMGSSERPPLGLLCAPLALSLLLSQVTPRTFLAQPTVWLTNVLTTAVCMPVVAGFSG